METLKAAASVLFWIALISLPAIIFYAALKRRSAQTASASAGEGGAAPQVASFQAPASHRRLEPVSAGSGDGFALNDPPEDAPPETPRERTAKASKRLMAASVPQIPNPTVAALPFLWDGERWHVLNLTVARFWGVFGTKQYGKSSTMRLLALLALMLGPKRVQVWAIDQKGGADWKWLKLFAHGRVYGGNPGMDGSVEEGYDAAIEEMEARYTAFDEAGPLVSTISGYHASGKEMSYILLFCDEVGGLPSALMTKLGRMARESGAAGFIVVVATQYPERENLPGEVQENLDNRLSLKLATSIATKVALGIGQGDSAQHDPSVFEHPGIAVLRSNGTEVIGRVAYIAHDDMMRLITSVSARFPRVAPVPPSKRKQAAAARQAAQAPVAETAPAVPSVRPLSGVFATIADWEGQADELPTLRVERPDAVSAPASDGRNGAQEFPGAKEPISGVLTAKQRAEQEFRDTDFTPFARLILASPGDKTRIIESSFDVKAGSSARYQVIVARIDEALARLQQAPQKPLQQEPEEVA